MEQEEEWRPIPEWEGLYEVSSLGRVRGVPRSQIRLGKTGQPTRFCYGYRVLNGGRSLGSVSLSDTTCNRQEKVAASTLMLRAFPDREGRSNEEWRDIGGWEGHYQVSDLGRVRSVPRSHTRKVRGGGVARFNYDGRILKPGRHENGYEIVALCDVTNGRKIQTFRVHRLVCEAFHGPAPSPDHEVAHNDSTRDSNAASNLRWATHHDNIQDAVRARAEREANSPR